MWIFKIGGSWIRNANLKRLINLLVTLENQDLIIVPGGGIFADAVREASKLTDLSEDKAHFLALNSTEIFGHMIKSFEQKIHLTENIKNLKDKNLWLPSKTLKGSIASICSLDLPCMVSSSFTVSEYLPCISACV